VGESIGHFHHEQTKENEVLHHKQSSHPTKTPCKDTRRQGCHKDKNRPAEATSAYALIAPASTRQ
jgi:hypothetical protein